jgi:hypothetical protein
VRALLFRPASPGQAWRLSCKCQRAGIVLLQRKTQRRDSVGVGPAESSRGEGLLRGWGGLEGRTDGCRKAKQMSGRKKNEANPVSGGKKILIYARINLYIRLISHGSVRLASGVCAVMRSGGHNLQTEAVRCDVMRRSRAGGDVQRGYSTTKPIDRTVYG